MQLTTGPILDVSELNISFDKKTILKDINFQLFKGDHLVILGPTGSGKTSLAKALAGKIYYKGSITFSIKDNQKINYVEQQHHFTNKSNTHDLYYQQRFNALDAEDTLTIREVLAGEWTEVEPIISMLRLHHLLDQPLIQLSNGEHKKLQLAKLLLNHPDVMILDSPFDGLDTASRQELHQCIHQLILKGTLIILISSILEIPNGINKVLLLGDPGMVHCFKDYSPGDPGLNHPTGNNFINPAMLNELSSTKALESYNLIIGMNAVHVTYGHKKILDDITWSVKQGEKWLLLGPNGSGKSTLLSLVTGDNPQAYANDIIIFDKQRGTGESIWDIKKKIGYMSPELHLFFDQSASIYQTVASGWFDSIGLFQKLSKEQHLQTLDWLNMLDLLSKKDNMLYELSFGQQRIVLLLRALVKNPPLIILDEPGQGLNHEQHHALMHVVDLVCSGSDRTLVLVTHYSEIIPGCIDHFIQLEHGKIKDKNQISQLKD
jgi:molybdate transport system ATP-binding protein